ncbi:class I SAM-dependent methyltransferase [Methylibium sp.]|jgi:SAM-dependent methyltransferase|uniref:class I SAM-dependent methyltransferase n=1 Tax=Methylibium sp. TaxID=2067992 RepID=UPI003D15307E
MTAASLHGGLVASPWVARWTRALPAGRRVLDLACGSGRHLRGLVAQGQRLTGVDRDAAALEDLAAACPQAELITADIESGPWPLEGRTFDVVIVTNYLWRPLLPAVLACVAPDGRLIYETFALGNQTVGKPSNPDFLLRPGELLDAVRGAGHGWRVLGYEDGTLETPLRFVQRIAAVREANPGASASAGPPRYPL